MAFIIRPATEADMPRLLDFAATGFFTNIPTDEEKLAKNIERTTDSFALKNAADDGLYIFVMEDTEAGQVMGTSCIVGRHGTPDCPHTYFTVRRVEAYSESLKAGFTHELLELGYETEGPTEVGGLYADPAYRKRPEKLGKMLMFVRFLFIKAHRARFRDQVIAELMAPISRDGRIPLWEEVGRKFTNLDYPAANAFSHENKEFILSLFPRAPIYLCMLSPQARKCVGMVHRETQPVVHVLEKIGFTYRNRVDPFDGGPHYRAETDEIEPVRETAAGRALKIGKPVSAYTGLVGVGEGKTFRAIICPFGISPDGPIVISPEYAQAVKAQEGEPAHALHV